MTLADQPLSTGDAHRGFAEMRVAGNKDDRCLIILLPDAFAKRDTIAVAEAIVDDDQRKGTVVVETKRVGRRVGRYHLVAGRENRRNHSAGVSVVLNTEDALI